MENEALKQVFITLHKKITNDVNPDSVIDELFANKIISDQDYCELYKVPETRGRCRKLLSVLHGSSHPETFIQLRLALLDEYPEIVDEIDQQRTSLTTCKPTPHPQQQQQLHPSQSPDGKVLLMRNVFGRIRLCVCVCLCV